MASKALGPLERELGRVAGGTVRDVATGTGLFAESLASHLESYVQILGIDESDEVLAQAREAVRFPRVRFARMNAAALCVADGIVDTVACAHALHHLRLPKGSLVQMWRVLKPGGRLIVLEPVRDGQAPAQQVYARLHETWAWIDRAIGLSHRRTYRRAEILSMIRQAGFVLERVCEVPPAGEDPCDLQRLQELRENCAIELGRAREAGLLRAARRRIADLLEQGERAGTLTPTDLLVVARKPRLRRPPAHPRRLGRGGGSTAARG